jgi:hypothetical protein
MDPGSATHLSLVTCFENCVKLTLTYRNSVCLANQLSLPQNDSQTREVLRSFHSFMVFNLEEILLNTQTRIFLVPVGNQLHLFLSWTNYHIMPKTS